MANKTLTSKFFELMLRNNNFHQNISKLQILTTDNGICTAKLKVEEEHTSGSTKLLHNGLATTITDVLSNWVVYSIKGHLGVTTSIQITFLKQAQLGDEVQFTVSATPFQERMVNVDTLINKYETGETLAKGSNTFVTFSSQQTKYQ